MCGANFNGGACCPQAQILKEEICGNFNGELADPGVAVWTAPAGSYISGTFQIFNSAASPDDVTGGGDVTLTVTPGNTLSQAVDNPTNFTITAAEGVNGTYCITLYKRVLA